MNQADLRCNFPRTGVAVIVTHKRKILFGKRIISPAEFAWQLPGGWIRTGESPEQTAKREVREETGLELRSTRFVAYTNNIFSFRDHSISLYFEAECSNPEMMRVCEPDKCEQWVWMDWQDMTDNLYLPLKLLRDSDYQPFLSGIYLGHDKS
jgi:8-oxo-dGTP diphosphatase